MSLLPSFYDMHMLRGTHVLQDQIYAIGDCISGPMLAHKAEEDGVFVAEQIAETYGNVALPVEFSEKVHSRSGRFKTWQAIKNLLSRLDPAKPRAHLAGNCLAAGFARDEITSPEEADAAFHNWQDTDIQLKRGSA